MTERVRQADVAYEAACKIISPKEAHFMVSLLCLLAVLVFALWVNGNTRWQHVIVQGKQIAALQGQVDVAEQLRQQTALLRGIADKLGVETKEAEE